MSNNGRQRNTGTNPRGAQWCYTLNNYSPDDVLRLRALHTRPANKVLYHAFQAEVGETGTPHLQVLVGIIIHPTKYKGYIAFTNTKMRSTVATMVSERAHLERTRGTPTEASDYCTDDEKRDPNQMDVLHTSGDLDAVPDQSLAANQPGKRTDLSDCKRKLDEGAQVWELADEHWGTVVRNYKAFGAYKHYKAEPRAHKTRVFVFYGAPGTGKSRAAFNFDSAFVVPASNGTQWMDGYDPERHRTVIFDDFHASVPAHLLLRLLDNYPLQFPVKGGFVQFRPSAVVLTSNYHPREWYKWNDIKADFGAFERRVDVQWCYFLPETEADKTWCTENEMHCLIRADKGDWHPQIGEFVEHGTDASGTKIMGVPNDALPSTVNLDTEWAIYESLMVSGEEPDDEPSDEPSVEEVHFSHDDELSSQSDSSSN